MSERGARGFGLAAACAVAVALVVSLAGGGPRQPEGDPRPSPDTAGHAGPVVLDPADPADPADAVDPGDPADRGAVPDIAKEQDEILRVAQRYLRRLVSPPRVVRTLQIADVQQGQDVAVIASVERSGGLSTMHLRLQHRGGRWRVTDAGP